MSPKKNGHHFTVDICKCIFFKESYCILIKISLKFVPEGPINNKPAISKQVGSHYLSDAYMHYAA